MGEWPLVLQRLYALVQGNARARKQEWVDWGAGWGGGEGIGGFGLQFFPLSLITLGPVSMTETPPRPRSTVSYWLNLLI